MQIPMAINTTEALNNQIYSNIKINFTSRPLKEWIQLNNQTIRPNWFQSWPFATARFTIDQLPSKWATIEINNKIIGTVLIQELQIGPIRTVEINRGPLWFKTRILLIIFLCSAKL